MRIFEYISNICSMFTVRIRYHDKSDSIQSDSPHYTIIRKHNLIIQLLEEGAIKKFIFDKVINKNIKYISDLNERELQELV